MNAFTRPQTEPRTGFMRSPATIAFARDDISRTVLAEVLEPGASTVSSGGVEEAIAYLVHDPAARTVLVDLSGAAEPLVALDRLAEACLPDTRVIALGDINDIHFYRLLRTAGVSEYLVKPITTDALRSALMVVVAPQPDAALAPMAQTTDGETIAVVGARGGVGATMVAVSLAWLSTENGRRRTVLTDLDLTCGSASLALDVESGHGLIEALANPDRIDALLLASATARVGENLYLLSSDHSLDSSVSVQPNAIEKLLEGLRQGFQRVVLDVPRSDSAMLRQALAHASTIVIVSDFSLAAVRDTGRLIALAEKIAPAAKRLVVGNRFGVARKGDLPRADIEKALGLTLACVIPEDMATVPQALNTGKPVPAVFPASPVTAALRELTVCLDGGVRSAPRGLLARFLRKGGS